MEEIMTVLNSVLTKISQVPELKITRKISNYFVFRKNRLERVPQTDFLAKHGGSKRTLLANLIPVSYPNVHNRMAVYRFIEKYQSSMEKTEIIKILEFDWESRKKAFPLIATKPHNLNAQDIKQLVELPHKEYKKALKVLHMKRLNQSISLPEILDLSQFSDKMLTDAEKLMLVQKGKKPLFNTDDVINIVKVIEEGPFAEVKRIIKANNKLVEVKYKLGKQELKEFHKIGLDANGIITQTNKRLKQTISPTDVSESAKKAFFKDFLANHDEVENVIRNANFEQYGFNGLPLKYSRNEFISDFGHVVNGLDKKVGNDLFERLEISAKFDDKAKFISYEGIPTLKNLDLKNPLHKKVADLITKFTVDNEITVEEPKLNKILNAMLHAFPEYANFIGKKIYGDEHRFSVDIHSLKVLKESLNNPEYKNLSDKGKTKHKLSIVFHDTGKQAIILDKGPQYVSALYTRDFLKKLTLSEDVRDAVYEQVVNSHWGEELGMKTATPQDIATRFREPDDYLAARIFAKSDLIAINDGYYNRYKDSLTPKSLAPIEKALHKIHQTGNIMMSNRIISPKKVPEVTFNQKKYKVINLTEMKNDQDLEPFGFEKGTTKENLRLLVHFFPNGSLYKSAEKIKLLSDISNGGILSASRISLDCKGTYQERKYGTVLYYKNSQIGSASSALQYTGEEKSFAKFIAISNSNNDTRTFLKYHLIDQLALKYGILSDKEYECLFNHLMPKKYIAQVNDVNVGRVTITKKDLKNAIIKSADRLLIADKDKFDNIHNEVVLYDAKMGAMVFKEDSLKKIPPEMLKFAHENNFPIILIGE